MSKAFESIKSLIAHFPSGSRVICDPPPMDTDEDHVLLVTDFNRATKELTELGYTLTTDPKYTTPTPADIFNTGNIRTFRKEEENLILVNYMGEYRRWQIATQLAKRFNLTNKQDRIDLFAAIRGGELP